jgi:hypothetical protein
MKLLFLLIFIPIVVGMWWFRASIALRNCYIEQVELQQIKSNKYTGVLSSGLATEKQIQLNDLVIDSYPECDVQVAEEYKMPAFGMNIIAAQASD